MGPALKSQAGSTSIRSKISAQQLAIDFRHRERLHVTCGNSRSFHRKNVHDQHSEQEHRGEKGDLKIPLGKSKSATAFALARRGLLQYSSWWSRLKRREIMTAIPANYGFPFDCFGTVRAVFRPVSALGSRLSLHDQGVYYRDRP
jgi:hypothetical protein